MLSPVTAEAMAETVGLTALTIALSVERVQLGAKVGKGIKRTQEGRGRLPGSEASHTNGEDEHIVDANGEGKTDSEAGEGEQEGDGELEAHLEIRRLGGGGEG